MSGFLSLLIAAAAASQPNPSERAAIFLGAGFVQRGTDWRTRDCEGFEGASYSPGTIDIYKDLNGDGSPEAVVSEGSAICYGNTGTRFWLLSKQANGSWRLMASEVGIPEFLGTEGSGGWPDILIGGPGFCFPVWQWNDRHYRPNRFEYEGKRCRPAL